MRIAELSLLATIAFAVGLLLAFVVGTASASASGSSSSKTTTTSSTSTPLPAGADPNSPAAEFFVLNGTVNAASDHEILGSSAFPNYTTGAVDNYYSMAHTHVDNSPFAEGTASPFDTGPIGQTAAAGNFQQPQYADARWPGDSASGKASYGTPGQPYAVAEASDYKATAEASEASTGLAGPAPSSPIATPKGFNGRLRQALAGWKAKWQSRPHVKKPPAVTTPVLTVTTPAPPVPVPKVTVTTPVVTVAGVSTPPAVSAPSTPPVVPSGITPKATPSRSLQSSSSPAPADGASLLHSSSKSILDSQTKALVTSGESSLGRVSLGGGQIVLEHIHVSASITNDGTKQTDKEAVTVGSASIGGVPVTIDQDGVHVATQTQALPYQQASDALNSALKSAGIRIFLVAPEVKKGGSGDQSGGDSGGTTPPSPLGQTGTTTTDSTTTSSSDMSCAPTTTTSSSGGGTPTTPSLGGGTSTNSTTTTTSSRGGKGTTTTTTTATSPSDSGCSAPGSSGNNCPTTTTGSGGNTDTTATTTGTTTAPSAPGLGGNTNTTTTTDSSGGSSGDSGFGFGTAATDANEESVTATGVHVVFTQPVDQSGVPAQFVEHILGEVFVDSLAAPAGPLPNLNLSSSCGAPGKLSGSKTKSGAASKVGGGSSTGGSTGSSSPSGSTSGSASSQPSSSLTGTAAQPTSGSTSGPLQGVASFLRKKPLWVLVAYLIWQALAIATGASLWHWRREELP